MTKKHPGWLCFHCGDYFSPDQEAQAREHFGRTIWDSPECQDANSPARRLARRARRAEAMAHELAEESEKHLYQALAAQGEIAEAKRYIGGVRRTSTLPQEIDSLNGRVLAAEAVVEYIAKRFPNIVAKARNEV